MIRFAVWFNNSIFILVQFENHKKEKGNSFFSLPFLIFKNNKILYEEKVEKQKPN